MIHTGNTTTNGDLEGTRRRLTNEAQELRPISHSINRHLQHYHDLKIEHS
jgi:hypothetical protein